MKQFVYGMFAGLLGTLGSVLALFFAVGIVSPERMPAPAIGRVVHLDEKLRFIRQHPEIDPVVVAAGSSITWRNLSGAEIERVVGRKRFINGAAVYMQAHQTRKLARFLVRHYRHVRTLLVLTNLLDFGDCTEDRDPMFSPQDAGRYAFDRWPETYFHLRYFAPRRYLDSILTREARHTPFTGDLYMDEYGSGPVVVPEQVDLGLRYKERDVDPWCVSKMAEMSRDMTEWGIRTMIVFTPIHPDYRERYPASTAQVREIVAALKEKTKGDNTRILTLYDDPRFTEDDFYDAFHLQWPAAKRLSGVIAQAMRSPDDDAPPPGGSDRPQDKPSMSLGVPSFADRAAEEPPLPAN